MEHRGEVHRLVEVALAGRTVAAEGEHHGVLAPMLRGLGEADRMQQLRGERRGLWGDAMRAHVVPRVPVALEEDHGVGGLDPASDHGDRVAIGREQPIGGAENHRGADLAGLLAVRRRVDGEAPLAHQGSGLIVDASALDEPAVGGQESVGVGERVLVIHDRRSALVDQLHRGVSREQVGVQHAFALLAELGEDSLPAERQSSKIF